MATPAKLLLSRTFDGAGYPFFTTTWPGFSFPPAYTPQVVNQPGWLPPVVDGSGRGFASRNIGGVTWRAVCDASPGASSLRANLKGKWKNPGFSGRREVGLLVRLKDVQNTLAVRVRSMGTASPELRLFKIVAGVETQLGTTYTGADLSATRLAAELEWGVRVEDLQDGTDHTKVTVYVGAADELLKGTQRLEWTGDLAELRGVLGVGVELRDQVYLDDVRVDDLRVFNLDDEWNPAGTPVGDGAGWNVQLGDVMYSLGQLEALTPKVTLEQVVQGYGQKGNTCRLRVDGDYRMGNVVFPGQRLVVLHQGVVRFRGRIADGELKASPGEGQAFNAFDAYWAARVVRLLEDDKTQAHYFNVEDREADEYDKARVGMTLGAILKWLLDRYLPELRAAGAAPASSVPYVQEELDRLAAVVPDVSLSGTLPMAVESLLALVAHRYQLWVDPADLTWHLRDTTNLSAETLECTAEWVKFQVKPDRDLSSTYVEVFGAKKEEDEQVTLSVARGELRPAWTVEQEGKYGPDKRSRSVVLVAIVSAGTAVNPRDGLLHQYLDVPTGLLDEDDVKGWITNYGGLVYIITNNTSTRVWLDASAWPSVPPGGTRFTFSATDPQALAELSAQGVGRVFYAPVELCPSGGISGYQGGLRHGGFCGQALAVTQRDDGKGYHSEEYTYKVVQPTPFHVSAGFCDALVVLSEKPKPSIGLINKLPPSGGSPPLGSCVPEAPEHKLPLVDVQVKVSKNKAEAPYLREPPAGYEGTAYSEDPTTYRGGGQPRGTDWAQDQGYILSLPDFTSMDQEPGLRLVAKDILAVKGQKAYLFTIELASPWVNVPREYGLRAAETARFAGMARRLKITSARRSTGFDVQASLAVYRITWDVPGDKTILEAGTASGWLSFNGVDVARAYSEARLLKKVYTQVKNVADALQCALAKPPDRIGGVQKGPVPACNVETVNNQTRRVVNIQQDDEDKVRNITHGALTGTLLSTLSMGPEAAFPGAPIEVPGRDGAAAQQVVQAGSSVLAPLVDPRIPFAGPQPGPNGDRGTYGGPIVTDRELEGQPPRILARYAGLAFRKQADAGGNPDGGPGIEWAALDGKGNPTGAWTPYRTPADLPNGVAPLTILGHGSTQHQLLERSRQLAEAVGAVEDAVTAKLLSPGEVGSGFPGGAPPDLAAMLRTVQLNDLSLLPQTWDDPGGPVWNGPVRRGPPLGPNSLLLWRVMVPENLLVRVTAGAWGSGLNGGRYSWYTSGNAMQYMVGGRVVHKQLHPEQLDDDNRYPANPAAPAQTPFGFVHEGVVVGTGAAQSGAGGIIPMPPGVVGTTMLGAIVQEYGLGAPVGLGLTYQFRLDWSYRATPWAAATPGTAQVGLTADGAGQATGVYKQPGGAVPPGLRAVAVSAVYIPGGGTAPPGQVAVVTGVFVDVAQVESGWFLRMGEAMDLADDVRKNHLTPTEVGVLVDTWTRQMGKGLAEGLVCRDDVRLELNPPLEVYEGLELAEAWGFSIQDLAEGLTFRETWDVRLNA